MEIFPEHSGDKTEAHLFDLLKRGYIDARYKDDYFITSEELTSLITKVARMKEVVEDICKQHIKSIQ